MLQSTINGGHAFLVKAVACVSFTGTAGDNTFAEGACHTISAFTAVLASLTGALRDVALCFLVFGIILGEN